MPNEFIVYLFNDLKSQIDRLKEEAYETNPDSERVDYHFKKAISIIEMLETKGFAEAPAFRVIGSKIG